MVNKNRILVFSFILSGFTSIISQLLILREFLVSFYGNELSIGIIYTAWLLWIGFGSLSGNYFNKKIKNHAPLFFILLLISPLFTVLQIILIKFSRFLLNTPIGEYISFSELLYFSFIILSFGCFTYGIIFALGARLYSSNDIIKWRSANRVYILETAGSALGGVVFSFLLILYFSPFQIISLLIIISSVLYITYKTGLCKIINIIFVLLIILIFPFVQKYILHIEEELNRQQWKKTNIELNYLSTTNTKYRSLSAMELNGQYTIYSDGKPAFNIPDTYNVENLIHLIFTQHKDPKDILILGNGFNGLITEILKYNIDNLYYIEPDKKLLDFCSDFLPINEKENLKNEKLKIIEKDGREFLKISDKNYDIIIVNTGDPNTLGANRYFTEEFYTQCYNKLNTDGIAAVTFPSSADYLGDELKNLNASIYHTFNKPFQNLLLIPGTMAILLGSKTDNVLSMNINSLSERFKQKNINCQYFSEYMFEQLMPPDRIIFIKDIMDEIHDPVYNNDMTPITYYFDMTLRNKLLRNDINIFTYTNKLDLFKITMLFLIPLSIFHLFHFRNTFTRIKSAISILMFVGGLCSIIFSLLFIFNFQVIFGSIYEMIGGMIAANMFGLSIGAYLIERIRIIRFQKSILVFLILFMISLSFITPFVMEILIDLGSIILAFINMCFYSIITGLFFGALNKIYLNHEEKYGSMYAWDVIGSAFGALICTAILIPIIGMFGISYLLAILLIFPLILLIPEDLN